MGKGSKIKRGRIYFLVFSKTKSGVMERNPVGSKDAHVDADLVL